MADKWPLANGNWSSAANWNGGTKPVAGDTVYADGKTVTIDEDIDISPGGSLNTSQRSGGTAGGSFSIATARTVKANIVCGTSSCVNTTHTSGTVYIIGNITGSATTSFVQALILNSTSAVHVTGNVTGGAVSNSPHAINCNIPSWNLTVIGNVLSVQGNGIYSQQPNGIFSLTGSITGGSYTNVYGIWFNTTITSATIIGNIYGGTSSNCIGLYGGITTLNITGNIEGGSGTGAYGLSAGTNLTINGNVTGGTGSNAYGLPIAGSSVVIVNGSAIPNDLSGNPGIYISSSSASLALKRAKGSGYGSGSAGIAAGVGLNNSSQAIVTVEELEFGSRGMSPVYGPIFINKQTSSVVLYRKSDLTQVTFIPADNAATFGSPATTDVRAGVSYALGNLTGTCAVPAPINVTSGVLVGNTVGTAILTEQTIRSAMGLSAANLDTKFNNLSTQIGTLLSNSPTEAF